MGAWGMLGAGIAGLLLLGWQRMFKKIVYNEEESKAPCDSEVVFFPDKSSQWSGGDSCGRGMEKVLRTLKLAEKNLDLALFSFSNRRIAREVINCVNRGVKVRLVADSSMIDQQGGQVVGKHKKAEEQKLSSGEAVERSRCVRGGLPEGRLDAPQVRADRQPDSPQRLLQLDREGCLGEL